MNLTALPIGVTQCCLALALLITCSACDQSEPTAASSLEAQAPAEQTEVVPGYGVQTCHVGMEEAELTGNWSPRLPYGGLPVGPVWERLNYERGMAAVCFEGRVITVSFYYEGWDREGEPRMQPFTGRVKGNITGSSSVAQVIEEYGEPSYRSNEDSISGGGDLGYEDKGIYFIFDDGRLTWLSVNDPEFDLEKVRKKLREDSEL